MQVWTDSFPSKLSQLVLAGIFIRWKVENSINLEPDLRNPLEDALPLRSRSK